MVISFLLNRDEAIKICYYGRRLRSTSFVNLCPQGRVLSVFYWQEWDKEQCSLLVLVPISDMLNRTTSSLMLTKWFSSTRLETRTKESNSSASIWVSKLECIMKVKVIACLWLRWDPWSILRLIKVAPSADLSLVGDLSKSRAVRTRKVVNLAWTGRSQGKPWWRLAAILTCKSFVWSGLRGERPIEPPGCWFPPKYLSGQQELVTVVSGKANDRRP